MTSKRYFQISLLLPIAAPLVSLFIASLFAGPGPLRGWRVVLLLLFGSLLLGGIPYILFAAGLFFWMRGKSAREVQRMTYVAPLLFIPVFVSCAVALAILELILSGNNKVEAGLVLLGCAVILIFGYVYVLAVNVSHAILKAIGVVTT